MYKLFLYTVLVLSYLGLAKMLSPSEVNVQYLQNEKALPRIFKGDNLTAILIDAHTTGFLIKTYYQKYRVISGFDEVDDVIVRTSKEFQEKHLPHMGLSLFRHLETGDEFVPLPPGSHYIDNKDYGYWKEGKDQKVYWKFHRNHKNLPKYLGWFKFKADRKFHQDLKFHQSISRPYFGSDGEFGPQGKVTQKGFPQFFKSERLKKVELKNIMLEYLKENF